MSSLTMLNLPFYLNSDAVKNSAKGVKLIGVLVGEVTPPEAIAHIGLAYKATEAFALVDLVGMVGLSASYFVRGQVLTVVPKSVLNEAKSKQSGRIAVELSGAPVKLSTLDGNPNVVTMSKWVKGSQNNWLLRAVHVSNVPKTTYPDFFNVIVKAYSDNWQFTYPTEIPHDYVDACEGYDFQQINPVPYTGVTDAQTPAGWGQGMDAKPVINPTPLPTLNQGVFNGVDDTLGTSEKSEIGTLIQNRNTTLASSGRRAKPKIENRLSLLPRSETIDKFEEHLDTAENKVSEIIESLKKYNFEGEDTLAECISYTANKLQASWTRRMGVETGRALFKEALDTLLPDFTAQGANGETAITDALNIMGTDLLGIWKKGKLDEDSDDQKFLEAFVAVRTEIYLRIIENLVGISRKLVDANSVCIDNDVNIIRLLQDNPYNLCFIDPRFTTEELDRLAMLYRVDLSDAEVKRVRNVAYLHNFMLDSGNYIVRDNTTVLYGALMRTIQAGFLLSPKAYDNLQIEGVILDSERITSLKYYIDDKVEKKYFSLPREGWKPTGTKSNSKMLLSRDQSNERVLKDYLESGLGVFFDSGDGKYVTDYVFARKELYIYSRLHSLCTYSPKKVSKEKINKVIEKFETRKKHELGLPEDAEYKLEVRQAEAVHMVGSGVRVACLTGPAGSGKTTTAEAMVFGLEELLGVKPDRIYFCAPTGKAANRLKEVVKRQTKTINSLFGIGGEGVSLKDPDSIPTKDFIQALIVDESSMPNINLMYELLLRVPQGAYVFFLGDKEQLPPIGFGKPFATMLTYLPTVVLNVTKRASDKSGITRNAKRLIYESDVDHPENLQEYDDYRIINTTDAGEVVKYVENIVRYHLGQGYSGDFTPVTNLGQDMHPDDIQVITPINKHIWGTVSLNARLQNIFNPKQPYSQSIVFSMGRDHRIEFRLNDRVMHVKANWTEQTRLVSHGDGVFTLLRNKDQKAIEGINNGDVGKIKAIYNAQDLDFSEESTDDEKALKRQYKGTANTLFMAVEYNDVDIDTLEPITFTVLYRMEIYQRTPNEITVLSSDLRYLDLAYALTVHKLQGSQAKLCICVFLPVGGDFISRNMLYTASTRAQASNYMLGDILGRDSTVNKGRRIEQTEKRVAITDVFV